MNVKILVVDDEPVIRDSLRDVLQAEGYQIDCAENGEAAIEALKQADYDLMLLDIRMPGMSGIEVLQYAGQIAPDTKVILLTAHGTLETAVDALRHGAHDYILKPASSSSILGSVARALALIAERRQKKIILEQLEKSLNKLKDAEGVKFSIASDMPAYSLEDGITFDYVRREIWRGNVHITLTPTEDKLLKVFIENRGRVIPHRELVFLVQGYDVSDWEAPEVLRPLVSRLRRKLSKFPSGKEWIINVRGTGYLFDPSKSNNQSYGEDQG
jgi:DNA-binding response OmpR family regulator